jgi:hypothetical protein
MKHFALIISTILFYQSFSFAQHLSTKLAVQIIELSAKKNQQVQFDFNSPFRTEWRRTPGSRNGIALFNMDLQQKDVLHKLLSTSLSSSGYNKLTHILFNEDLSKDFDPETGQNKYWFAIYGTPGDNNNWGWRLEGHHLSLHFTLKGERVLSTTPFEIGSYPAIVENDSVRAGFRNLSHEIDLGFEVINSLNTTQLKKAIIAIARPNERMMGESYSLNRMTPIGLPLKEMNEIQRSIVKKLVGEYLGNFASLESIDYSTLHLAWWGPTDNTATYWYRLHSSEFLIDFENIGNHIHCVMRFLKKDFGTNPYGN